MPEALHLPQQIVPTASERVYDIDSLLEEIYRYLPKEDLVKCMGLRKEGLEVAAKLLYGKVQEDIGVRLDEAGCSNVSMVWLVKCLLAADGSRGYGHVCCCGR